MSESIVASCEFAVRSRNALAEVNNFDRSLNRLKATVAGVSTATAALGATWYVGISKINSFLQKASEAQETTAKFDVVFRNVKAEAESAFKTLVDGYNMSAHAARTALSDTGDLLSGFGFTAKEAIDLSMKVQTLAADLSSFTNYAGGAKGASEALTKALLGEREQVKMLGVAILEEDVKAQMAEDRANGLVYANEKIAKAYATYHLTVKQSANAMGDTARSTENFQYKMNSLNVQIETLGQNIGKAFIEPAQYVIDSINGVLTSFNSMDEGTRNLIVRTGAFGAAVIGTATSIGAGVLAYKTYNAMLGVNSVSTGANTVANTANTAATVSNTQANAANTVALTSESSVVATTSAALNTSTVSEAANTVAKDNSTRAIYAKVTVLGRENEAAIFSINTMRAQTAITEQVVYCKALEAKTREANILRIQAETAAYQNNGLAARAAIQGGANNPRLGYSSNRYDIMPGRRTGGNIAKNNVGVAVGRSNAPLMLTDQRGGNTALREYFSGIKRQNDAIIIEATRKMNRRNILREVDGDRFLNIGQSIKRASNKKAMSKALGYDRSLLDIGAWLPTGWFRGLGGQFSRMISGVLRPVRSLFSPLARMGTSLLGFSRYAIMLGRYAVPFVGWGSLITTAVWGIGKCLQKAPYYLEVFLQEWWPVIKEKFVSGLTVVSKAIVEWFKGLPASIGSFFKASWKGGIDTWKRIFGYETDASRAYVQEKYNKAILNSNRLIQECIDYEKKLYEERVKASKQALEQYQKDNAAFKDRRLSKNDIEEKERRDKETELGKGLIIASNEEIVAGLKIQQSNKKEEIYKQETAKNSGGKINEEDLKKKKEELGNIESELAIRSTSADVYRTRIAETTSRIKAIQEKFGSFSDSDGEIMRRIAQKKQAGEYKATNEDIKKYGVIEADRKATDAALNDYRSAYKEIESLNKVLETQQADLVKREELNKQSVDQDSKISEYRNLIDTHSMEFAKVYLEESMKGIESGMKDALDDSETLAGKQNIYASTREKYSKLLSDSETAEKEQVELVNTVTNSVGMINELRMKNTLESNLEADKIEAQAEEARKRLGTILTADQKADISERITDIDKETGKLGKEIKNDEMEAAAERIKTSIEERGRAVSKLVSDTDEGIAEMMKKAVETDPNQLSESFNAAWRSYEQAWYDKNRIISDKEKELQTKLANAKSESERASIESELSDVQNQYQENNAERDKRQKNLKEKWDDTGTAREKRQLELRKSIVKQLDDLNLKEAKTSRERLAIYQDQYSDVLAQIRGAKSDEERQKYMSEAIGIVGNAQSEYENERKRRMSGIWDTTGGVKAMTAGSTEAAAIQNKIYNTAQRNIEKNTRNMVMVTQSIQKELQRMASQDQREYTLEVKS